MSIVVHVNQDDQSICQEQKKLLESAIADSRFKNIGAYRLQFNSEKAFQNVYQVREPCVLLVFKGSELRTRIQGNANIDALKAAMLKAL